MRHSLHIQLQTIPDKGWDFHFDRETKDFNNILKDLIDNNNYSIDLHIQPIGEDTYKITGSIQTDLNLLCSRCAYEFKHPLQKQFSEKVVVLKKQKRGDKEVRINHYSEQTEQSDFTIVNKNLFKLDEFIYEVIAVEEPLRPVAFPDCEKNDQCVHLKKFKQTKEVSENKNPDWQKQLKQFLDEDQSSAKDSD